MTLKWTRKYTKCPTDFWYTYGKELELPFYICVHKYKNGWMYSMSTNHHYYGCQLIPSELPTSFHTLKECKKAAENFYRIYIIEVIEPLESSRKWFDEFGPKFGKKNPIPKLIELMES